MLLLIYIVARSHINVYKLIIIIIIIHRIKLKECEKKDKYLDLAWGLKKNYGTWRWQLYQLWLVLFVHSQKDY